jgi:hypothetical protein
MDANGLRGDAHDELSWERKVDDASIAARERDRGELTPAAIERIVASPQASAEVRS